MEGEVLAGGRGGRLPAAEELCMFIALFLFLLVVWFLAWAAFHVAGGFIHLLLVLAFISIIVHFVRGRRAV
jgi:hypothetical protein